MLKELVEDHSEKAEKRWIAKGSPYFASFVTSDLSSFSPSELLGEVVGQFSLLLASDSSLEQTSFKSLDHLKATFASVSSLLSSGGHFVGFVWDSAELWRKSVEVTSSNRRRDENSTNISSGPTPPPVEHIHVKDSFQVAGNHIQMEIPHLAAALAAEKEKPNVQASKPLNRYFGIDLRVTMEGKTESSHICHIESMMEVAKSFGFVCCSFRNLLDFYDSFKVREEEGLKKLQVFTRSVPKLLPEQKEAASMMAVFVFRKS